MGEGAHYMDPPFPMNRNHTHMCTPMTRIRFMARVRVWEMVRVGGSGIG